MGFKEKWALNVLRRKAAAIKRKPEIPDADSIRQVGIIWHPGQEEAFGFLKNHFEARKAVCHHICITGKKNPEDTDINHLNLNDLNWSGIPKSEKTEFFINKNFDILFSLTIDHSFTSDYITAIARAKFKIGSSPNNKNYFDLNINIGQNRDALFLAKQQIFYLGRLNNNLDS